jgi:ribonuclease D
MGGIETLKMKNDLGDFYITSQTQLNSLLKLIAKEKLVALDTEFTRQTTYYPILSIVQVAVKSGKEKKSFIIDCVSDLDLSDFFAMISNEKIKKILHSSSQDLQIFYIASNTLPRGIIDTQIMANFCGFDTNIGYSNLVKKIYDKTLNKDQQRSDWQRRPLSQKQIDYALLDVEFLHEIYEKFFETLEKNQRQKWFAAEMERFIEKSLNKPEENMFRNFSAKNKNAAQKSQLRKLVLWRENLAQKENLIRQYFLKDEDLEKIIDQGFIEAKSHARLTKSMVEEIELILADVEENFDFVNNFFMTDKQKALLEKTKDFVEKIAKAESFSAQFLLTILDLKKIICQKESFDKIVTGWRHELLGKELKELIS